MLKEILTVSSPMSRPMTSSLSVESAWAKHAPNVSAVMCTPLSAMREGGREGEGEGERTKEKERGREKER